MRDWDSQLVELQALGGQLAVLSAESVQTTRAAAADKELLSPMFAVSQALWAEWDIANPSRPELPRPGTYVVAPDGRLIWARSTGEYSDRTSAQRVVDIVRDHMADGRAVAADLAASADTDWSTAVEAAATRDGRWVEIEVRVAEGLHVYGRRERQARPLSVSVDGAPARARVERGVRTPQPAGLPAGLPDSFLLTNSVVRVRTPSDEGVVHAQACAGSVCGPPLEVPWAVAPE